MKDRDIQINYGIKTGYNDAFIIDNRKRIELIKKCPESESIIRPILLGKDLKRYSFEWKGLWLINSHNGVKSKGIARIDLERDYPVIYRYLSQFKVQLERRLDKGDHWTNLRNCAYLEDFNKPKIAWGNLTLQSQFSYIPSSFLINAPSPFFATKNFYLLAVLNSKLGDYYIKKLGVSRSGGYFEYKPMFVQKLPIPQISEKEQDIFHQLTKTMLSNKEKGISTAEIEKEINELVFNLYHLTNKEKNILRK